MASVRPLHFRNGYIYHVYNRGVERRQIFLSTRDRERFCMLLEFYRFLNNPKSFSHYLNLAIEERKAYHESLESHPHTIEILAYCLMPNHFHLLLKQHKENGIKEAISNISNGYAKYFNTKRNRVGPLFQGPFKAVRIETDEQLLHVSRYIHINPVIGGVIVEHELLSFPWSSFASYVGTVQHPWVDDKEVLAHFRNRKQYGDFVSDQLSYAKDLEKIKHLLIEGV